ncbi:Uncharacterized protein APZ42_019385 [Daphnia magna]|uniref:Uncharacterized protein n=1 Tax=Daphnia magna TaxID=35525 RepID=A0A162CF90_9CRUS|nr:Uncharacterized protein APZ42_019385 [Daphnia magna]
MGQKQSSSTTDCEISMMNRTDLSSHFTHLMSKSYQADECFNCGARLEDNNLFNSSGTKSSDENSVRCRQCRVCNSTNVIVEKFREVVTSSPRSIRIHHPSASAECQLFIIPDTMENHPLVIVSKEVFLDQASKFKRKKEIPENCAFCDEILHPFGITFDVNKMDVHVWCHNCGKKNSCGTIRKKQFVLSSLPVEKRLVGYQFGNKSQGGPSGCLPVTKSFRSLPILGKQSMLLQSEGKQSLPKPPETEKSRPSFNRLTPKGTVV